MKTDRKYAVRLKRAIDIVGATSALVAAMPLMIAVGVAIVRVYGRPIFFGQDRPVLNGDPFRLYKFRTMTDDVDSRGGLLADDDRLTRLGRGLRLWSIDELPELWNVMKGDMSLVGPRPLLLDYLELYSPEQKRRHDMRPGLTGLAQVSGRNEQSWEHRLADDVWYVDHWSLWLDAKILTLTVVKVLTREGISASGSATMPRFEGHFRG